jgi:hypothetical protein
LFFHRVEAKQVEILTNHRSGGPALIGREQ